jgi:hypothetical protein
VLYQGIIGNLKAVGEVSKTLSLEGGGGDINDKKPPLAACNLVTRQKMKGGIGVIKLRVQNDALLMKNLHKFFNKHDLPWVNLIWSNYYRNGRVPGEAKK